MEKGSKGGRFSRPPPTSPRGHPKKKLRREAPPRPLSTKADRYQDESEPQETKALFLGGYAVQEGPSAPSKFTIRGTASRTEASRDDQPEPRIPQLENPEDAFYASLDVIFSEVQTLEMVVRQSGFSSTHPIARAAAGINQQLDPLSNGYHAMGDQAEGIKLDLRRSQSLEEALIRDREAAYHQLSRANQAHAAEVSGLRLAENEAERARQRLKRDFEELGVRNKRLEGRRRELLQELAALEADKHRLEASNKDKDEEIERLAVENRSLQTELQEKAEEVGGLKSDSIGLCILVQQRDAEVAQERAERLRLQSLIREMEAQTVAPNGLPTTPQSLLEPPGPFMFPTSAADVRPTASQPHFQYPSEPFIKQEAPDPAASSATANVEQNPPTKAMQRDEPAHRLDLLGAGVADTLSKVFHVDRPAPDNDALVEFLTWLGTPYDVPTADSATPALDSWALEQPWTTNPFPPSRLPPTLEEQFALLCMLFPFRTPSNPLPSQFTEPQADEDREDERNRFFFLAALLTALAKADHRASPRAGWAFLHTVARLAHQTGGWPDSYSDPHPRAAPPARYILLSVMLRELCRAVERCFCIGGSAPDELSLVHPSVCLNSWMVGIDAVSPAGELASALSTEAALKYFPAAATAPVGANGTTGSAGSRRPNPIQERLAWNCGDQFCAISRPVFVVSSAPPSNPDGNGQGSESQGKEPEERREIGLLHCGDSGCFLLIDFASRSLRLVDHRLAKMRPNTADPRKFDVIVARERAAAGPEAREEEVLMRVEAAPRDVSSFWVKYAMGDDDD